MADVNVRSDDSPQGFLFIAPMAGNGECVVGINVDHFRYGIGEPFLKK